jgi:hypothetical protein
MPGKEVLVTGQAQPLAMPEKINTVEANFETVNAQRGIRTTSAALAIPTRSDVTSNTEM